MWFISLTYFAISYGCSVLPQTFFMLWDFIIWDLIEVWADYWRTYKIVGRFIELEIYTAIHGQKGWTGKVHKGSSFKERALVPKQPLPITDTHEK